jgi:hypothetical protein
VELRLVLFKGMADRLSNVTRFIERNLPFVSHVAIMGMEMRGYAHANRDEVRVDLRKYQTQIEEAVIHLNQIGIRASLYNLPLCALREQAWDYARKSISDWKRELRKECDGCAAEDRCCGFFGTGDLDTSFSPIPVKSFNTTAIVKSE